MNLSFSKGILFLLCVAFFTACNTTSNVAQTATSKNGICQFYFGPKTLSWVKIEDKDRIGLTKVIGTTHLPSKFEVYTIQEKLLNSYLKSVKEARNDTEKISFPLPENLGCLTFIVQPSGILSDSLANQFPDLISLKGIAEHNQNATVRIDYSKELKLRVAIWVNNQVYIISPWPGAKKSYYLLYKKEDSGIEKLPFKHY